MNLNVSRINHEVIKTRLDEKEWHRIVIEAVAQKAGVQLDQATSSRAYISTRDTSYGFLNEVEVEIIIDHEKKPRAVEP